jgi:ribosomal protein S18 acetylase RimI-like enzyme|tara:strand:+ start:148 stop:621 length:474 start_codon:yes stop_codon:yes gene_type:complete
MDNLEIVPFNGDYKSAFESLNREWIEEYFVMEEEDLKTLQNPESYIMEKGGEIFFAVLDGDVVGTSAMIQTSKGIYELAKMSVAKKLQGLGIGKKLLKRCIDFSKEREATEIFLITNDSLKPALNLYQSCGFVLNEQNDDNRYERGNTKMTLILGEK